MEKVSFGEAQLITLGLCIGGAIATLIIGGGSWGEMIVAGIKEAIIVTLCWWVWFKRR